MLIMERLLGLAPGPQPSAMVVSAHPDDETIGAGAQLSRLRDLLILEVTDGSPIQPAQAQQAGFAGRRTYAAARRNELLCALRVGGVSAARLVELGIVDQEAALDIPGLTRMILRHVWDFQPEAIVTHPYEGGHPDHDACAFAVQETCEFMSRAHLTVPARIEMTSYHAAWTNGHGGRIVTEEFLPAAATSELVLLLGPEEQAVKRRMFECFRTQQAMLAQFRLDAERFRLAPHYDFSHPPHPGRLFYENYDWGMTGARWRELACEAMRTLEAVPEP